MDWTKSSEKKIDLQLSRLEGGVSSRRTEIGSLKSEVSKGDNEWWRDEHGGAKKVRRWKKAVGGKPLEIRPTAELHSKHHFNTLPSSHNHCSMMLITFEGLDYSGKSTQVELLVDRLTREGYRVLLVREPGGTVIGEKIRSILLDKNLAGMTDIAEVFLFSASRSQLVQEVIKPALDAGTIVVCDRFYDSTTAYQGWGRKIRLESVEAINRTATSGLVPDMSFFLDIPLEELERRMLAGQKDRMELNGREFYEQVRKGYLGIAKKEKRVTVVDGLQSVDRLAHLIWGQVESQLGRKVQSSTEE